MFKDDIVKFGGRIAENPNISIDSDEQIFCVANSKKGYLKAL